MNKNSIIISSLITASLLLFSCDSSKEFDSEKWKERGVDWQLNSVREDMIDDLIGSDILIGLNEVQVIEILGQPSNSSENELKFLVREKYGSDIDPDYISYLVVELNSELVVSKCHIEK